MRVEISKDRYKEKKQPPYPKFASAGSGWRLNAAGYSKDGASFDAAQLIRLAGGLEWNKKGNPLILDKTCPNFIINTKPGTATLPDIIGLMTYVHNRVYAETGNNLIREIKAMPIRSLIQ